MKKGGVDLLMRGFIKGTSHLREGLEAMGALVRQPIDRLDHGDLRL
jgi:hypothetical protein